MPHRPVRYIDRVSGERIRRYEHPHPGSMIHGDVTKFGNIPDGGGHRFVGRQAGNQNRTATPDKPRSTNHNPKMGTAFVHTVIDDHSPIAYAEIHENETSVTAIGVLERAVAWFTARGVTVCSECFQTTARPIAHMRGAMPAPSWRSRPSGPGPTDPRPMARSSDSTGP